MVLKYSSDQVNAYKGESVVYFVPRFDRITDRKLKELDESTMGAVTTLMESGEFSGKSGETATLYRPGGYVADRVILTGLGDRITKCTLCTTQEFNRIDNGKPPACVQSCPTGALQFGDRGELLSAAEARVAALQSNGSPAAMVYGKNLFDGQGTHVLYVLEDSPDKYGLPLDPKVAGTATAWQDVIKPLGYAAAGVVGLGLILNIMVARARIIAEKEG